MRDSVKLNSCITNSFSLCVLIMSPGTGTRVRAGTEILRACLLSVPTFTAVELKKKNLHRQKFFALPIKSLPPGFYQRRSQKELTAVYVKEQDVLFSDLFFRAEKKFHVELKTRKQRTMKTLICGSSTITGLRRGHLAPSYLRGTY